jgi:hypothetical protein
MRAALLAVAFLSLAAPARADTALTVGAMFDARFMGPTWDAASTTNVMSPLGGARITMSFEPPRPMPTPGNFVADLRLVPELVGGFLADDQHSEGHVGAGLRIDARISSLRNDRLVRGGIYLSARALVMGAHQDGAIEIVSGDYIMFGPRGCRLGWEGGAIIRPRQGVSSDQSKELDAVISVYIGR